MIGVVKEVRGRKQLEGRGDLLTCYLRPPDQLKSRLLAEQQLSEQGKLFAWLGLAFAALLFVPWLFVIWFLRSRRGAPQTP